MLSFHSLRFQWPTNHTLEIEWSDGEAGRSLSPPKLSNLVECQEELQPDRTAMAGIPAISWQPDLAHYLFQPLQLREHTEYLVDMTVPCDTRSAVSQWQRARSWPLPIRLSRFYKTDPPRRWHKTEQGVQLTGRLNFGSYVGLADLTISGASKLLVEVVPAKIGYVEDLQMLLDQIAEESALLLLEIESPTFYPFEITAAESVDPLLLLFHVRRVMSPERLPIAMETITRTPRSSIKTSEERRDLSNLGRVVSGPTLESLQKATYVQGGPLSRLFRGHTPSAIMVRRKAESVDTPENRYVKAFLEQLLQYVETLRFRLERIGKSTGARQALTWSVTISDWLSSGFWKDVGKLTRFPSNSLVLIRQRGYREVLSYDLSLQAGLRVPWPRAQEITENLEGDLKPMEELYEYWCFFVLRSILKELCTAEHLRQSNIFKRDVAGLAVTLRRGVESTIEYTYRHAQDLETSVLLFHNRSFAAADSGPPDWDGSYSGKFVPDFSILVSTADGSQRKQRHWLHFDAKYRLDPVEWKAEVVQTQEIETELLDALGSSQNAIRTYRREDLYVAHTYRDAILGSRGVYILYPGSGDPEEIFLRYPRLRYGDSQYVIPSIGAFQLRPGRDNAQRIRLRTFLEQALGRLTAGRHYTEEHGFFPEGSI